MRRTIFWIGLICLLGLALAGSAAPRSAHAQVVVPACPTNQGYLYQGRLSQAGLPAQGSYDFQFNFYPLAEGGNTLQTTSCPAIQVESGLFAVGLNLPETADLSNLYLEVSVAPAGSSSYQALLPRQKVAPVPLANQAAKIKAPLTLSAPYSVDNTRILTITAGNGQTALQAESKNLPAIFARSNPGANAAEFYGSLLVEGQVVATSLELHVRNPLKPADTYIPMAPPISPEKVVTQSGNVILDAQGQAVVSLPTWFEAMSFDYRYTLTPVGGPAPNLYVSQELLNGVFRIAGGPPGLKVSWQVSGLINNVSAVAPQP